MGIEHLNEAIKLTKKGWVIHPLACPKDPGQSPGKRPLLNSWQKRRKATVTELREWFERTDNNVGLVLGTESGIIVIDLDKLDWVDVLFPPGQKILERTLRAGRTTGRGHVYFKFTDKVGNWKFHEFGIEILGAGNQVVVPPSIHREGQQYEWQLPEGADLETFELPELPETVIETIILLKKLNEKIKGCRTCFKWIINQSKDAMHGKAGRRLMLATATELKSENVTLEEFRLYAKKVYGDKYDPEGKRLVNIIRSNTKKMGELIDDLLALSRLGRKDIEISDINMDKLVKGLFDELGLDTNNGKVQFNIKHLPFAQGDQGMIRQVFANLLLNAIKFTKPKEAVEIEVGGYTDDSNNVYYVKDNGVGFDMQYKDKLFGVFQRLHSGDEFEGTGIGLAIVQRIIKRHGGIIWAEGKVNEGATFYFALPVKEDR